MFKIRGEGENLEEKNAYVTNAIRKLNYTPNFILIGQWRSVQNQQGERLGRREAEFRDGGFRKKNVNVTNGIPK